MSPEELKQLLALLEKLESQERAKSLPLPGAFSAIEVVKLLTELTSREIGPDNIDQVKT